MNPNRTTIVFAGGVGTATGANFLLNVPADPKPFSLLVDCGLLQGETYATEENHKPFPYDPARVGALFVTHAHADHIGRIPKLVREGFHGPIYSTPATRELAAVMFDDMLKIMTHEARDRGTEPLYGSRDVSAALSQWHDLPYHKTHELGDGFSVIAKDSGHILGSAYFQFSRNGRSIVFSGDLGNSPSILLRDTEPLIGATYLVTESVYGDRNHEGKEDRREKLRQALQRAIERKGVLIIPAFSLERSQDILYEINDFVERGGLPSIPVFLDSPLAIKVTEVYRKMERNFNVSVRARIASGDDIFKFPRLKFTASVQQSERIDFTPNPKVIIAGGGMSQGGRVLGHEREYLPDPNAEVLLVGYQAVGTLGRQLQNGAKRVTINGKEVAVRASVSFISGYSSHKDSDHLVEFIGGSAGTLEEVFVAMGEPKSSMFLAQRIKDELGINAVYPELGSTYEIKL